MENHNTIKDKAPGVQTGAFQRGIYENQVHFHKNQKDNLTKKQSNFMLRIA